MSLARIPVDDIYVHPLDRALLAEIVAESLKRNGEQLLKHLARLGEMSLLDPGDDLLCLRPLGHESLLSDRRAGLWVPGAELEDTLLSGDYLPGALQ